MMKKLSFVLMALLVLVMALAGCSKEKESSQASEESEASEWSKEGIFLDDNENLLTITYMEDGEQPGWYVGCMLGEDPMEDAWGGLVEQKGNSLYGAIPNGGEKEDITVTVTEEGEDGMQLVIEGGDTYHFKEMDIPDATIFVNVNTEGMGGHIDYAEGEEAPEIDTEYPYSSAVINLAEPKTHTFVAWAEPGYAFVKWTKNGEDYSTDATITVLLDESADYIAVFEEDPNWQNPVMNVIGEYQCERAHALVECFGMEEAWITIEWAGSASDVARWDIVGKLNTETMTIEYSGASKSHVTYDENGEIVSEEQEDGEGSGTITFNADGTFTWHEDQSETGEDMVFEPAPVEE